MYADDAPQRWPGMPLVVLVDSGTRERAEIVAGALQDHDRALVVGTATYGKGSAQTLFPLAWTAALKLTTALWYTPLGRSINRPATPTRGRRRQPGARRRSRDGARPTPGARCSAVAASPRT